MITYEKYRQQKLLELKGWAHQLFDLEVERRRTTRNNLYRSLKKVLGRNPHFATMDEQETIEAINVLIKWSKIKKPKLNSKKSLAKKEYKEIKEANKKVSQEEIRKAIARLPKNKTHLWKRIWKFLTYTPKDK